MKVRPSPIGQFRYAADAWGTAVGASPAAVSKLVLSHALVLVLMGSAIGIPAAFGATSLVRSLLFGVSDKDVPTLAVTIGVLALRSE